MKKTPLQMVKERYGDKKSAVEALKGLVGDELIEDRFNEQKGLAHVSNAKVLKLIDMAAKVKQRWGSRGALIDAILKLEKRKDPGYKIRLEKHSLPRLYDRMCSLERRARQSA